MSLNPEQLGLVNRAKQAPSPFDVGACFNVALATLKRDTLNIVLANLIAGLVMGVVCVVGMIPFIGWIAIILLLPPLVVGFIRFNAKCVRGQPATLGDCFSGFDVFGTSVLAYVLMILLIVVGTLLCVLPGIYLMIGYAFVWNLLAERRGTAWECLEMSRRAITAHWGWALLLMFVASLLAYVGIIACIIGVFVTMPFYGLMLAAAYDRLFAEQPPQL
ncbi:MAG: hypothetical protein RL303_509 [Verrucomicrobiota bacterium]|jgi:uncharacterized membrane protein